MAKGLKDEAVKKDFFQHANEEQQNVTWIAERISQLNSEPDFNPDNLISPSHSEYQVDIDFTDVIKKDVAAERIEVESYAVIVRRLGDGDPVTRRLIVDILKVQEERAEDMANSLDKAGGK
jgi:bacterioferritin